MEFYGLYLEIIIFIYIKVRGRPCKRWRDDLDAYRKDWSELALERCGLLQGRPLPNTGSQQITYLLVEDKGILLHCVVNKIKYP